MEEKFFLTDLDGTLLRSDSSLSAYSVQVLNDAMNRGAVISYATARSWISSRTVVSAIPWRYPLVLYNGALLLDPGTGDTLDGSWLEGEMTENVIELGRKHGLTPLLFALDAGGKERVFHEKLLRTGDIQFYNSRPNDPRFREVKRLHGPNGCKTLILTYIGLLEELEPLRAQAAERFGNQAFIHLMKDSYIADHYFLEFSHPLANKQEGLRRWAKLVGCAEADVTVFGDNLNDRGMFVHAGRKIAVANAHPDIRKLADDIAGSNDEDGVARYIHAKVGGLSNGPDKAT